MPDVNSGSQFSFNHCLQFRQDNRHYTHSIGTHSVELISEFLCVLAVLQLGSALVPLGLAEGPGQPLHLATQLPHIPLQLAHLALPLGLAALQLLPQLMPALLQRLHNTDSE